ncbi:uncharacterized protein Dwil_GK15581 [Drosophila willistoni]|uniref:Uncharacterized protein n=2 Tax=Drosophila willistoni TaxID=7260 RepID=B4NPB0_DROWI|nr:uncharacterized protein Dwil_GK15581 [Drosophila willistoni]
MDNTTSTTLQNSTICVLSPDTTDTTIEDLFQLGAMRRYSEDLKNTQRQVEEHARLWADTKLEYLDTYKQLCDIMKQVALREILDTMFSPMDINNTEEIVANTTPMRSFLTSDKRPMQVADLVLQVTQDELKFRHNPRHKLDKQQRVFAENHEARKSIAEMMENMKKLIETLIQQVMDQSVVELSQMTAPRRENN